MPAIVKSTINLFRASRKADQPPVQPEPATDAPPPPLPPPVPPPPLPPARRYSPPEVLPKSRSRASMPAQGRAAADMTPSTQAKVLPWVDGVRNQVYEEPAGLFGPYPAPPTRPQSLYSPPPLPHAPFAFAALAEAPEPAEPALGRQGSDAMSRGAGLDAMNRGAPLAGLGLGDVEAAMRTYPSLEATFAGTTPPEGSFGQDLTPLSQISKKLEKKKAPRQSHSSMPPRAEAFALPRIHKQRHDFPFSIDEAMATQERDKARADAFAQLVANNGKPVPPAVAKLGSPFRPDTFETLPTSTDTSFGHIAHENGRPIASAVNTPHAPKRVDDKAKSMPPATVPQEPPFFFSTTSPGIYMGSLRFAPAAAPVQQPKVNEVRMDARSAYVETVSDESATPRVRQKSERATVVNAPSVQASAPPAVEATPKAGPSHTRHQSVPMSVFSEPLSDATFKVGSYAPTTTTGVHNMVEQSSFHDETLCQLLDAARLNLIGDQAKKALMRAARARVIELKDIKEQGVKNCPPVNTTSPLAIRKKKHHRAKTEGDVFPRAEAEGSANKKQPSVDKTPPVPRAAPPPPSITASDRVRDKPVGPPHSSQRQSTPPWANEIIQRLEAFDARFSELGKRSTDESVMLEDAVHPATFFGHGPTAEDMEVLKNALTNITTYAAPYSYATETIGFELPKAGSIHTIAPTPTPNSDPQRSGASTRMANLNEATPKQRDTLTWGSEVDIPQQTPPLMPRPPRIEIQPPTTLASKTTTARDTASHSPTNNASGSTSEVSNARTNAPARESEYDRPPPVPPKSVAGRSVANTEPKPSSSAGKGSLGTPQVKPADLFSMTTSPATTHRSNAASYVTATSLKPWDLVTQRLYAWALVWEEDSFVRALERMALGFQVDDFPLTVYTMLIFKRNIQRRLTMTPPLVCDKLFVPPNIADGINKSVHSKQFSDAQMILESLWHPFRLKDPPRIIVSLMKHGGRDNTWLAARHDLTTGKLLVYVVGPGLQDPPEGKDMDNRVYMWWLAIRQAWPQYNIPHTDETHRLPYTIKMVPVPASEKENASLQAMVISRNFLLGMRPETTDDQVRLREAVWGEVRRLLLKKQQGKLHVHGAEPRATDTISNL